MSTFLASPARQIGVGAGLRRHDGEDGARGFCTIDVIPAQAGIYASFRMCAGQQ